MELATRRVCQDLRPCAKPGRLRPNYQTYENMRHSATDDQTSHHHLRSDDLGTKRLSAGVLLVPGGAVEGPGDRGSSAAVSGFCASADVLSGFAGFAGNNALDQPRSRSSDVISGTVEAGCGRGVTVSNVTSLGSKYASFGMSKFGALPFSTVIRMASANPASGRSQSPDKPQSRNRSGWHWTSPCSARQPC